MSPPFDESTREYLRCYVRAMLLLLLVVVMLFIRVSNVMGLSLEW